MDALFDSPVRTTFLLLGTVVALWIVNVLFKWWASRSYFDKLNIKGPKPLPLLGNMMGIRKHGLHKNDENILTAYGKTAGYFEGATPMILTKDAGLIKAVTVKEFNSFTNRRTFDGFFDEPLNKFLTVLKDDEWKNVRSLLTSTFTSGKLKSMSKCVIQCANNFEEHLEEVVAKDGILEAKVAFGSYTLDVISSCCFGIEINAIKDPENVFLKNLQQVFANARSPKLFLVFMFPRLSKFLSQNGLVEFFPMAPFKFLESATIQIINRRRSKEEYREDFIQHMLEHEQNEKPEEKEKEKAEADASKEENKEKKPSWSSSYLKKSLTDKEILAQAIMFLAAGYETTATTIVFTAFNLAHYQECQKTLRDEIDQVLEENNGEINYDTIGKMSYLEAVVNETLRLYPPAARIDRVCSADYEYADPETGLSIKIPKGQIVAASIWSIHHDPANYPEPEKFNPDRFTDRSNKIENEKYIPFGNGPRNCIAMRFALMEAKLLIAKILCRFEIWPCEKTPSPETLEIDKGGLVRPANALYLQIKRRADLSQH